ncbi:putative NADH-flavin reductase [Kitasatospora sp. GP30]|uniref:NAD(P)-dependent oxidoreductase n=1 Tax=Kitasatospora sp. GP30 TaxID=3035084 RepID=UPI000CCB7A2E|nr:NAD(P)H-binding protein [Kitasatospora sp. GP30]MDH6139721.1 putative NADH-flavin reductase [Kitasatospora sp. GP30]
MSGVTVRRIAVFGAGGRAGRWAVAEAARRGHEVTAVVRSPAKYPELTADGVTVVAGDVTDRASVTALTAGHDAVISAAGSYDVPADEFFPAAARSLAAGLADSGVRRLVAVGIGTALEAAPGVPLHDTEGFPPEHRGFSIGHAAELTVWQQAPEALDWVVLAPPPTFLDADGERTGRYRTGGTGLLELPADAPLFRYADLAVALVDEAQAPRHHRALVAVAHG